MFKLLFSFALLTVITGCYDPYTGEVHLGQPRAYNQTQPAAQPATQPATEPEPAPPPPPPKPATVNLEPGPAPLSTTALEVPEKKTYTSGDVRVTVHKSNLADQMRAAVHEMRFRSMSTTYSKSFDRWSISSTKGSGSLYTTYSKSYDNWTVRLPGKTGYIRTVYSNSYDRFKFGSITMSTTYSKSWDRWTVRGKGTTLYVSTTYSKSWDNWKISSSKGSMYVTTRYSKSFDNWKISDNMPKEDMEVKFAAIFTCIFSSSIPVKK